MLKRRSPWLRRGLDVVYDRGKVGIGTTEPVYELDVNGFVGTKSIYDISDEGLVLAMNFNRGTLIGTSGSEKVLDSSGYNNHGTNHGATFNATGGFNGGGALQFDGVDDYVRVAADSSLNITETLTIEAWVKPLSADPGGIISKYNTSADWAYYIKAENNKISGVFSHTGDWGSTSGIGNIDAPVGQFTHIAIVFDYPNQEIRGYSNGAAVSPSSISAPIVSKTAIPIRIGNFSVQYANALIDEVRIYNRALSADEIKAHYLQRKEHHNSFVSQKDVYVDANGNVGIGTTGPSGLLHLAKSGGGADLIFERIGTYKWKLYNPSGISDLRISAEDVGDIVTFKPTNGNVGIGTTSPDTRLDIADGALTLLAMTQPSSPANDSACLFVEASGTSPNRTVALKVKFQDGTVTTLASTTV